MSMHTESNPLIRNVEAETNSGLNSFKNLGLATESTPINRDGNNSSRTFLTSKDNQLPNISKLIKPKFFRLDSAPTNNIQSSESIILPNNSSRITILQESNVSTQNLALISSKNNDDLSKQNTNPELENKNLVEVKPARRRSLWKNLLSLDPNKGGSTLSAGVNSATSSKTDKMRRRSTHDEAHNMLLSQVNLQKDGEDGQAFAKKPGVDFTLDHFKLLRKQIENEKKVLEQDIKVAVEEKEKKESSLNLSQASSKKWEKAKKNVLVLARVKRLNDDLRLWGSSMNVGALNPQKKDLKMLMPETQFNNDVAEKKQKKFMLYPHSRLTHIWQSIYLLIMMYTAFVTPYRIAFIDDMPTWWFNLEQAIDILFFIDILVVLNSAQVLENGDLNDDRKQILHEYLKGWLIPDIIAIIPFYRFIPDSSDTGDKDYNDLAKMVRLPRLYKLIRITKIFKVAKKIKRNKYFQEIQDSLQINVSAWKIISFFLILLLSVHVFACLWYFAASFYNFTPGTWVYELGLTGQSNVSLYVTSVYWVVSTLTTVGFGDVHAFNDLERLLSIFWIIIGVGFYSLNIGAMTSLLANKDTREGNLSMKLVLMDEFAQETGLPKELRLKIKRTLEYNSLRNVFNQFERNEFFEEIPVDVKSEMAEVMHRGVINKLKFFKNKDRVFIATMVPLLQPLKVAKGEIIYRTGEYPINIYFIISGRVNIVVGAHMLNLKTYVQGSYFGEIEMVNNTIRQSTIRAEMDCELLTLSRKAFLRLMEDFPNYREELKQIAEERQLRIHEALRKIKQLLPISFSSKFWEKKRKHSLYDLDEVEKPLAAGFISDRDKSIFGKKASRFGNMLKPKDNLERRDSLGDKIEEEENEDDDEDAKVHIPRQILENAEASGKIANLINAQELKEEENKITKWITQMQNNRSGFNSENRTPEGQGSLMTHMELQAKLMQAEGDAQKKKTVLIVKEGRPRARGHTVDTTSPTARGSMSAGVTPNPAEIRRQSVNRKSHFTPSHQNRSEEDDDDEAPAMKLRKAMTFKLRQEGQKKHRKSFFNKIFDSPKTTERKDEEVGKSDIFDNFNEEKIDIVEIPTKVIENFTQKMSRGNSRERQSRNPRVHSQFVDLDHSPVPAGKNPPLRSFPNVRGGSPVEEKFTPSFGFQPKLDTLVKEKTLQDSQYSLGKAESVDSKEYQMSDQVSDNSPPKVVVIDGMTFNKKASITKDKKTGSPHSAGGDAHEEDEIPGIALAVTKSDAQNRKYRLSIYNAPNTEQEAGKVLRSLFGAAADKANAASDDASDSDDDSGSSSNSNQSNADQVPDEIKMKEEPEAGEYKIRIISPESSFQPKESQTVQDSEFKTEISEPAVLVNFGTPSQGNSENNTYRNPSIGSNLFEIPKEKSFESDSNSKQGQKAQGNLAVPLLRINSNDANNLSLIGGLEGEEESAAAEENNNGKMNEKPKDDKDISPEKNQSMKFKEMSPPAIITNTYWKKKIFDFHQKANQVDGKETQETEVPLKKVGSEEKKNRKEKSRKNQKIESNKYKKKYRKQSKYIKELLSGFKDIRKEFGDMKGDVMSIQGRLDNFEKLMDNLQGLITVFASKVKEKNNKEKKAAVDQQETKESSSTQVEVREPEPTSMPNRDDSLSATVYLPQKKTIVFSFQKPQASSSSSRARKGGETLQSMPEEEKERLSDSSLELINQTKDDLMKEIPQPPARSSPNKDVMKPSIRRVPKLKLEGSKAGFEILDDKSTKYQKNEETDKFL